MNTEELLRLIEAVRASDFAEFSFENQDVKMTLRRQGQWDGALAVAPPEPTTDDSKGLVEITAPMVGTFYHAPSPEAEPFVGPGSRVKPGDALCILEAMKLMNEIEAEVSGEIVEIIAENGRLVEYGQVLMTLRPQRS